MSPSWSDYGCRVVALLMIAIIMSGCGGHVEVPREQFEAATHDEFLSHRIRTKRTEYIAHHFSLTDSTLVITELAPADTRYRLERPPFIVPRDEIESIAGVKSKEYVPYIVVGTALVGTFLLIRWAGGAWSE